MKPKNPRIPALFHHKATGQDAVCIRDPDGSRRTVYLGKHDSPAAQQRYREVLAEHLAGKPVVTRATREKASEWPTVEQLAATFLLHAQRFYVDDAGKSTREVASSVYAFRHLLDLHRDTATDRIRIRDLIAVRQAMVDHRETDGEGRKAPKGLCRRTINQRMQRVKALFRWGCEQGLVPGSTWHELSALRGLPKGRCGVHDNKPVEAVPWALVEATLPHLVPTVRAAVLTQWWTGMRPAEVLGMTRAQLDMSSATWTYRPVRHKGSWRDRERVVAIGPKAQEILRPRLQLDPEALMFSPRQAWEEFRAAKREGRQTPPTKQMRERDARAEAVAPKVETFRVDVYRKHIERACDKAEVERWSPHRLRHAAGTRFALQDGIEAARAALGHADLATTRRYAAGADAELAIRVAGRLG